MIEGGCQCGAVRYRAASLGRSSVCHCRMCARAFGGFYAPLVIVHDLRWITGAPSYFQSSNLSKRGFCNACGTPMTLENIDDDLVEVATGTLDDPEIAPPTVQINHKFRYAFTDGIGNLDIPDQATITENDAWNAKVVSNQHPLKRR